MTATNLNNPQTTSYERYNTFAFYLNVVVIPITVSLGLLGNLISIFVLHKDRYNRVAVFLLQNLALANCFLLLMSFFVLTVAFGILGVVVEDYAHTVLPFIVVYVNPLGSISNCYVIWSTILLALNRYAAICRPFTSKNFLKLSSARIQVAVVVILSVLFSIPHFFTYDIDQYFCVKKTSRNCSDDHVKMLQDYGSENIEMKYNFTLTPLGDSHHFQVYYQTIFFTFIILILPLVLLIALHVPIIRQLQNSKKRMKSNCLVYDGKNEDNITVAMVTIIISLVICHVMERICEVAKHLSGEENSDWGLLYAQNISNFFVQLKSSTDFIIYYILKKRFRKEFWRRVHLCCGCKVSDELMGINSLGESAVKRQSIRSDSLPQRCTTIPMSNHQAAKNKRPIIKNNTANNTNRFLKDEHTMKKNADLNNYKSNVANGETESLVL